MDQININDDIDPEYVVPETIKEQLKIKGDKEANEWLTKVRTVIDTEFQRELKMRENQLELIQQRITKTCKTLHLLRYVLVSSYYNNPSLQLTGRELDDPVVVDPQKRIHPAIKKILGNHKESNIINTRRKVRKVFQDKDTTVIQETAEETMKDEDTTSSMESLVNKGSVESAVNSLDEDMTPKTSVVRNRVLTKYKVIVGNISKYIPAESPDDKLTHKWMVYVRGPKRNPDISGFVDSVVFYLHPSYKPNDVIHIQEYPFHLTRRGWGEFPIRVQLYFKHSFNKPVDIIHKLKLDKTYIDRQTLGAETIVEISLYTPEETISRPSSTTPFELPNIKQEIDDNSTDSYLSDSKSTSSFPTETQNTLPKTSAFNFLLQLPDSQITTKMEIPDVDFSLNTDLAFNNDFTFDDNEIFPNIDMDLDIINTPQAPLTDKIKLEYNFLTEPLESELKHDLQTSTDYELNQAKFVVDLDHSYCLMGNLSISDSNEQTKRKRTITETTNSEREILKSKRMRYEREVVEWSNYINISNMNRFNNLTQLISFLLKKIPLVSKEALDDKYKQCFPFVSKDLQEYRSWHAVKRYSCEWSRARTIKKIITQTNLADLKKWSTKSIVLFARAYGYSPFTSYKLVQSSSERFKHFNERATCNSGVYSPLKPDIDEVDVDVDVNIDENRTNDTDEDKSSKIILVDKRNYHANRFIREHAFDAGVLIKKDEIVPGVLFNTIETVLLKTAMCFAEDLIRCGRAHAIYKSNAPFNENRSIIQLDDIKSALSKYREEFKQIKKWK